MASFTETEQTELAKKFESWFVEKLQTTNQNDTDSSIFINYILSTLNTEDNTDEEKADAILPFLQELNQNNNFDEQQFLEQIIKTYNQMKIEFEQMPDIKKQNENQENPTDTILNMINKHKTQLVKVKKSEEQNGDNEDHHDHVVEHFIYEESDEESKNVKDDQLFVNKNTEDALNRDKQKRDQLAELSKKQKEQAKKALVEQRQREEDKKKKAQQKAAKVERKR